MIDLQYNVYPLGPRVMTSPQLSLTEAPVTLHWLTKVPSEVPRSCST